MRYTIATASNIAARFGVAVGIGAALAYSWKLDQRLDRLYGNLAEQQRIEHEARARLWDEVIRQQEELAAIPHRRRGTRVINGQATMPLRIWENKN